MKIFFGLIFLLFILNSCAGTPTSYFDYNVPRQKASAESFDGGFGGSWGRPTIEIAVFEALMRCENFNPTTDCQIVYINDRTIPLSEAHEWKRNYKENLKNYSQVSESVYDPTVGQSFTAIVLKKREEIIKKDEPKFEEEDNEIIPAASGSGFYISSDGYILTNHHVVEGCQKISLTHKGKELEADVLAVDSTNDLAVLKSKVRPDKFYKIRREDPKLLEDIIIAGYPLGKQVSSAIKTTKGTVTSLAGFGDNYSNFQTDAALNQGNSGGPIIDDSGNVVGIAVAVFGKEEGIESFNFGIKSSTVRSFIESNNINYVEGSKQKLTNEQLGDLIISSTIYLECWLTVADIKRIIAQEESTKAFYKEYQ